MYPPLFCLFKPLVSFCAILSDSNLIHGPPHAHPVLFMQFIWGPSRDPQFDKQIWTDLFGELGSILSPDLGFRVCNFGFIPVPLLASVRVEEDEARERQWLAKIKQERLTWSWVQKLVLLRWWDLKPLWVAMMNLPHLALPLPMFSSSSRWLICYKVPAPSFTIRAFPSLWTPPACLLTCSFPHMSPWLVSYLVLTYPHLLSPAFHWEAPHETPVQESCPIPVTGDWFLCSLARLEAPWCQECVWEPSVSPALTTVPAPRRVLSECLQNEQMVE